MIGYAAWYTYREMIPLWKKRIEKEIELIDQTIISVVANTQALDRIKDHLEVVEGASKVIVEEVKVLKVINGKVDVIGYDIKELHKD